MDRTTARPTWLGVLEHIHTTSGASQPMTERAEVELVAGLGIPDDRYALRTGTYSPRHHIDRQVTLIEAETLEALARDRGLALAPAEHRRNLTTRGAPLNHLVGRYFSIGQFPDGGGAVLYGGRLNVPCRYLEELLGRPVFRPLIHRSGLNARVVVGGTIRPGDPISPVDPGDVPADVRAANEATAPEPSPDVTGL